MKVVQLENGIEFQPETEQDKKFCNFMGRVGECQVVSLNVTSAYGSVQQGRIIEAKFERTTGHQVKDITPKDILIDITEGSCKR